jgi:hypothetical protein
MHLLLPLISFLAISYAAPVIPSHPTLSVSRRSLDPKTVNTKLSALMHSIPGLPEDHQATIPPAAISASSVPSALPIASPSSIDKRQADFSINTDEVINHAADLLREMLEGSSDKATIQKRQQAEGNGGNLQAIIDAAIQELLNEIRGGFKKRGLQHRQLPANLQAIIDAATKALVQEIRGPLGAGGVADVAAPGVGARNTTNATSPSGPQGSLQGNLQAIIDAGVRELIDEILRKRDSEVVGKRQIPESLKAIVDAATKELVEEIRGPAAGAGVAKPAAPASEAAGNASLAGARGNLKDVVDAGVRELVEEIRGGVRSGVV